MSSDEPTFLIGAVSERTGLTAHTLRFYEKEGLFLQPIERDDGGRRRFTESQIDWLRIGGRLRAAGMPLPEIRRYAEAGRDAANAAAVQLRLLRDHEQRIQAQMAELQHVLTLVTAKMADHQARE